MYCVHCGAENPTDASYCRSCGQSLGISRRRRWPVAPDDASPAVMQETVRAGPAAPPVSLVRPTAVEKPVLVEQVQETSRAATVSVRVQEPETQVPAPQAPSPVSHVEPEEAPPKKPRREHEAMFRRPHKELPPEPIYPPAAEEEPRETKPSLLQRLVAWIKERRERRQNERAERRAALAQRKKEQDAAAAAGREEKQTTTEAPEPTKAAKEPVHTGPRLRLPRRAHKASAPAAAMEIETAQTAAAFEFTEDQLVDMLFSPSSDDDPAAWGESPENLEKKRSSDIDAKKVAQIALVIGAGAVIIILVAEFAFN